MLQCSIFFCVVARTALLQILDNELFHNLGNMLTKRMKNMRSTAIIFFLN